MRRLTVPLLVLLFTGPVALAQSTPTPFDLERLRRGGGELPIPAPSPDPGERIARAATISGSSAQREGTNAAFVGDVNGDGLDDVATSFSSGTSSFNEVHLYFGGISLSGSPDVTIRAVDGSANFGFEVSGAGDLNGDGYADVFISSYGASGIGGRGYVYFGRANWPTVLSTSSASLYLQPNNSTASRFGFESNDAGDVNGDGYDDLIVGDYALNTAYIFYGGAVMNATPDVVMTGALGLGYYVAGVGDLNEDGYPDVAVGATQEYAYVYHGGSAMDASFDLAILVDEASFLRVEGGGDVNGDGAPDLLLGTWWFDSGSLPFAGGLFVVHGGAGMDALVDVTITGTQSNGELGWALGALADVDGDGYADVLAGESGYDGVGQTDQGRVLLFRGGPAMDALPDAIFEGDAANDNLGEYGVALGGDTDGDGYGEILISSRFLGAFGEARLYRLGYRGDDEADARLDRNPSEAFGTSAAVIDINNDGYDDLAVGAESDDTGASNAGAVRIFYGGPLYDATPDVLLHATEAGATFGRSLATVGDVNGDGYDDLVVGAPNAAGGVGRAYLFLGGAGLTGTLTTASAIVLAPGGTTFTSGDFGLQIAGGADYNGDGFDDIVVSDPDEDFTSGGTISNIGAVYLFLGGATPNGTYDAKVTGFFHGSTSDNNNNAGQSVALADLTGDGLADIVFGVTGLDLNPGTGSSLSNTGGVFLFPGRTALASLGSIGTLDQLLGTTPDEFLGVSMAVVDLNRDGLPDLAAGSYAASGSNSFAGRVRVFEGEPGFRLSNGSDVSSSGASAFEYYSYSLAPGGDVNGDGYEDLLVGSYTLSGYDAHVLFGEPDPDGIRDVRLLLDPGSYRLALAAPDLNGDGLADPVVGDASTSGTSGTVSRVSVFLSTTPALRPGLGPVRDVPGDQGGFVRLEWSASGFEMNAVEGGVQEYRVYRASPPGPGGIAWEHIGTVTPGGTTRYAFTAPTVSDQTTTNAGLMSFRVTAVVDRDFGETEYFHSLTRTGASVDNLAPGAPPALTVTGSPDGDALIGVTPVDAPPPDLAGYAVFRSADDTCDAADPFVGLATDPLAPSLEDDATPFGTDVWYCTAARDVHGNDSPRVGPATANPAVLAAVKVVLQGAYAPGLPGGALMRADLEDVLPMTQPYGSAPWNYAGSEAIPATDVSPANGRPDLLDAYDVVDWVLVSLRSTATGADVARAAALLLADGTLLDPTSGAALARARPASAGTYHIVVRHRNHLAAMTAFAVSLSSAAPSVYDMSVIPSFVYGTNPVGLLAPGVYGFWSGDADGNGVIGAPDRTAVWLPQVGGEGYLGADLDLDGRVLADDRQRVWQPNVGRTTQVPGASFAPPSDDR